MRWMIALAIAALAVPAARAEQAGGMAGGCEDYSWDMRREMAAWDEPGLPLEALADASTAASPVPLDRKIELTLHPLAKTRFAAPPERTPAAGYAGLVPFSVPADGVYRIAAGSRVWLDVVEGAKPVASAKFEGRAGCAKVHKVVAFALKAGRPLPRPALRQREAHRLDPGDGRPLSGDGGSARPAR